ncbi:hypothetical protein QL285_066763 [Trifolium repens]|nr:hypothetical protein QL285_066763 [Trifolium repens]
MSNGMEMFIKIHGKKKKSFRERALNYLTSAKDSSVQALIDTQKNSFAVTTSIDGRITNAMNTNYTSASYPSYEGTQQSYSSQVDGFSNTTWKSASEEGTQQSHSSQVDDLCYTHHGSSSGNPSNRPKGRDSKTKSQK